MDAHKSILPDIDMEPAVYNISGTGPAGETFNISTEDETAEIENLMFGEWDVSVQAENIDGTVIAQGDAATIVNAGETSSLFIIITPLDGTGSLNLTLQWNGSETRNPSIAARLIPVSGTPIDLSFAIAGSGNAVYSGTGIPAGYYTLTLQLIDNGALTMGAVEVVRVVKDETTSGSLKFDEINPASGNILVNIVPDLKDPLAVSISGQSAEIYEGQTITVTASVPDDPDNAVYVWYINGASAYVGRTYTLGAGMRDGIYRVDVTAYSPAGDRAGSATFNLRIIDVSLAPYWARMYGDSNYYVIISPLAANSSANFGAGHYTKNPDTGQYNLYQSDLLGLKIDVNGNIAWSYTYNAANSAFLLMPSGNAAQDGGYIFGSNTIEMDEQNSPVVSGISLLRVNGAGAIMWSKGISFSQDVINNPYIYSLSETSDGGIIMACAEAIWTQSESGDSIILVKLDSSGNQEWVRRIGEGAYRPFVFQNPAGGYYLTGEVGNLSSSVCDLGITKLSASGTVEWQKIIIVANDYYNSMAILASNGDLVILGGSLRSYRTSIIRLSSAGDLIWQKGYNLNPLIYFASVVNTADGGFAVNASRQMDNKTMIALLKVDSSGIMGWCKQYYCPGGAYPDLVPGSVLQMPDGGYMLNGGLAVIRTDGSGNVPGVAYLTVTDITAEISSGDIEISIGDASFPVQDIGRQSEIEVNFTREPASVPSYNL